MMTVFFSGGTQPHSSNGRVCARQGAGGVCVCLWAGEGVALQLSVENCSYDDALMSKESSV